MNIEQLIYSLDFKVLPGTCLQNILYFVQNIDFPRINLLMTDNHKHHLHYNEYMDQPTDIAYHCYKSTQEIQQSCLNQFEFLLLQKINIKIIVKIFNMKIV